MTQTVAVPMAVTTGVVVIVVAAAVVLIVLIVAMSMRGRQVRAATRRDAERRERAGVGGSRALSPDSDPAVTRGEPQPRDD